MTHSQVVLMNAFWIALLLCLLGWVALCLWLTIVYRPRYAYQQGMELLSQLPESQYRQACQHMLEEHRHWRLNESLTRALPGVSFAVHDGQQLRLVACRQGLDYVIDANAIGELAASVRLTKAAGAALISQSAVDRTARQIALRQQIELIDGQQLWPMVQPLLPESLLQQLSHYTRRKTLLWMGLATVVLASVGIGLSLAFHAPIPGSTNQSAATSHTDASVGNPNVSRHEPPSATSTTNDTTAQSNDHSGNGGEPNAQDLARARMEVAHQLSMQPGITRCVWISPSTIAIDREADDVPIWQAVCDILGGFPELGGTRVQLNPRPNHNERVHWRQCSSY